MRPSDSMTRVIDGKRYSVATATEVAHNAYWDGHNHERSGTNIYLYRTPRGRFFAVHLTQWQGSRDEIEPLSRDEALMVYEDLREHTLEVDEAFGITITDA